VSHLVGAAEAVNDVVERVRWQLQPLQPRVQEGLHLRQRTRRAVRRRRRPAGESGLQLGVDFLRVRVVVVVFVVVVVVVVVFRCRRAARRGKPVSRLRAVVPAGGELTEGFFSFWGGRRSRTGLRRQPRNDLPHDVARQRGDLHAVGWRERTNRAPVRF
jgi:hypothetical protein